MANPIPDDAREATYIRGNYQCALCGMRGSEIHHRKRRREGGHGLENLVLLCHVCHHQRVHARPDWARERGYIVSVFVDDVAAVPLQTFAGPMLYHADSTVTYL